MRPIARNRPVAGDTAPQCASIRRNRRALSIRRGISSHARLDNPGHARAFGDQNRQKPIKLIETIARPPQPDIGHDMPHIRRLCPPRDQIGSTRDQRVMRALHRGAIAALRKSLRGLAQGRLRHSQPCEMVRHSFAIPQACVSWTVQRRATRVQCFATAQCRASGGLGPLP